MSNGYSRRPLPSAWRWPEFLGAGRRRGVAGGGYGARSLYLARKTIAPQWRLITCDRGKLGNTGKL
jgi:hypothetical protein